MEIDDLKYLEEMKQKMVSNRTHFKLERVEFIKVLYSRIYTYARDNFIRKGGDITSLNKLHLPKSLGECYYHSF